MLAITLIAALSGTLAGTQAPIDAPQANNQIDAPSFQVISDTEIIADGHTFRSWTDLYESGYYSFEDTRCRTDSFVDPDVPVARGGASDCSGSTTNPLPKYDPSVEKYRIPVVVHVIQNSSGTGFLSDSRVASQIDILNEDFQAMAGTNGALGNDAQIEFYLATEDPDGNPTTGITRTTNTSWFNDNGTYYNSLAWDTNRYLNIYTNSASGALGYVPALPQGGIVGSNSDRVVVLYSTFGRNAPFNPFNLGRTATHEVGHYLGLYHTFDGGCHGGNCNTRGDTICDTNPESSPTFGCPGSRTSCSLPAPFDNYMDYSDDRCMDKFTQEQNNRMRCTLINYRPNLYSVAGGGGCSDADLAEPFGTLNFFDVSAFLGAFSLNENSADMNNDGAWNFFDVSAYLGVYGAGCP